MSSLTKESLSLRFIDDNRIECGCDEAGRGPLAGDVFAAAVILPDNFSLPELNDSKKLSEKKRYALRPIIEEQALAFGIGRASVQEIDELNILHASFLAMHRAIEQLNILPERLLIDGNHFDPYPNIEHHCLVKGDAHYLSIAAASILAKTYRDDYMEDIAQRYPHYAWDRNKGYPTKDHYKGLAQFGKTPLHRISFRLTPKEK